MYILIKDSIPQGYAILAAAHASIAVYQEFHNTPEVIDWISGPFYKVICKVSDNEFENAKRFEDNVILTESSLDNLEVAIHPGKESCLIS